MFEETYFMREFKELPADIKDLIVKTERGLVFVTFLRLRKSAVPKTAIPIKSRIVVERSIFPPRPSAGKTHLRKKNAPANSKTDFWATFMAGLRRMLWNVSRELRENSLIPTWQCLSRFKVQRRN